MPICGIYKIENLINHHCYIGQSVDIENRWLHEYQDAFNPNAASYNYPLSRAFRKYSKDQFNFSVIEQCSKEELNQKERYWISYYNSFFNGYNQTLGGDSSIYTPKENIIGVIQDLKTTNLYHREIAQKWGVSQETVQGINTGRYWFMENEEYPLQKQGKIKNFLLNPKKIYLCEKCGKEISKGATLCRECYKKEKQTVARPNKEELEQILFENKGNFTKVAALYGLTDNSIRKWCDAYGLPRHSADYKIAKTTAYSSKPRCVAQIDIETNKIIATFDSIMDAMRALQREEGGTHISQVCRGERKTAYGYKWQYID